MIETTLRLSLTRTEQYGDKIGFVSLLEKAKLAREISDGKNEIPHKFLGRKI